jgi:hypothetical protein
MKKYKTAPVATSARLSLTFIYSAARSDADIKGSLTTSDNEVKNAKFSILSNGQILIDSLDTVRAIKMALKPIIKPKSNMVLDREFMSEINSGKKSFIGAGLEDGATWRVAAIIDNSIPSGFTFEEESDALE